MTDVKSEALATGSAFCVLELAFTGPDLGPGDSPARDIELQVHFRHEQGEPGYTVQGFWDGDGQGGLDGNAFRVRFCPPLPGRWWIEAVKSDDPTLAEQHQGRFIEVSPSTHPGFWLVDLQSRGLRWYKRSDGSHPYIIGNTHYSFLSGYDADDEPSQNDIAVDVRANAHYFKKLRFSLFGDIYPHPTEKPFLDDRGHPTDWGDHSHRPNPRWFHQRVDLAVQTAYEADLIADLILAGPDSIESRTTLRAAQNNGDPTPYLRYIAARYGSFPNVWFCLCNEFDLLKKADFAYTEAEIVAWGQILRRFLPYPTPLSVHASPRKAWPVAFDHLLPWHDHHILQLKVRNIAPAADSINRAWANPVGLNPRLKPTVNDELSYQGEGDQHSESDTIEAHVGAFLGGGYASTGEKPGNKLGQYFRGRFNVQEHSAAASLGWFREQVETHMSFWRMEPDLSVFEGLHEGFRGLAWPGYEYVLGTNRAWSGLAANLPPGRWQVTRFDVINRQLVELSHATRGTFHFDTPDSRAVLFFFRRLS